MARGPSPQVRGTVPLGWLSIGAFGTIPAGAGNSSSATLQSCPARDHPRRCGEQVRGSADDNAAVGPSPQVRGTGIRSMASHQRSRTIPAGAGNRNGINVSVERFEDHPRRCGEQSTVEGFSISYRGPSPQVRGTDKLRLERYRLSGTIPAGAGNSPQECVPGLRCPGPSPQVRGTEALVPRSRPGRGTIPAGAGNSACYSILDIVSGDHPRRCGEQPMRSSRSWRKRGPSPQVRGTVRQREAVGDVAGTIPAGAGNSRSSRQG